ncbi:MAG: HAD family hydrolase [Clostridia bacterium]|nr:HAD family hydrolase [Clostridia bacterium]
MITHIIWDYNGTVADDVDASVAAVNDMLKARGLPPTTKQEYTSTVSLPLDNYYNGLGIADADMEKLSWEFRTYCQKHDNLSRIFDGFHETVEFAKAQGIKNILMSSLYIDFLKAETEKYNISDCFDEIIGMTDTLVGSKYENAKNYIDKNKLNPKNILFVGDLINDAQTAKALGAQCILIPNGHNSKEKCQNQGVTVVENIKCIKEYICRA